MSDPTRTRLTFRVLQSSPSPSHSHSHIDSSGIGSAAR
jgi:hypothetical protein